MKNIQIYHASKYNNPGYVEVSPNIFQHGNSYVTSLCFTQEPELGEGKSAADISQYPLEDLLDYFNLHISDFYSKLNTEKNKVCYIEFSGSMIELIESLLTIVGKRIYSKDIYENGEDRTVLIIE